MQEVLLAVLLWPVLFTVSNPINCGDEQNALSNCLSISQEKLLDRVIQHAELIYRVSEESCSLFVSITDHPSICPRIHLSVHPSIHPSIFLCLSRTRLQRQQPVLSLTVKLNHPVNLYLFIA